MNKECAEYLNATKGRWDEKKSDDAIHKINHKKIVDVMAGRRVGNYVAQWARDRYECIEDTEVLCYVEDGRVEVGIRFYGEIPGKACYEIMAEMKRQGLEEVDTVMGLEDDGYVTMYGVGPYAEFEAKVERIRIILGGIAYAGKSKVSLSEIHGPGPTPMMWIKNNDKNRATAAIDMRKSEDAIRLALKGLAKIRRAEWKSDCRAFWVYVA